MRRLSPDDERNWRERIHELYQTAHDAYEAARKEERKFHDYLIFWYGTVDEIVEGTFGEQ